MVLDSSTIIEEIETMRRSGLASLAMFYHDFREDHKKDFRGLLSSMLIQLCRQSDAYYDLVSKFYSDHENGSQDPGDDELVWCFKNLVELPGQAPIYLIIDGLDECPNTSAMPSPRENVLSLVKQLIESGLNNLRICVTSRPETDIKVILDPLTFRSISIHDEGGQMEDIENYIKSIVNTDPMNRRWKAENKQIVIDVLTKRADGM
jgi:NACHT domain